MESCCCVEGKSVDKRVGTQLKMGRTYISEHGDLQELSMHVPLWEAGSEDR